MDTERFYRNQPRNHNYEEKPKLKRHGKAWYCFGELIVTAAKTPKDAYNQWKLLMISAKYMEGKL